MRGLLWLLAVEFLCHISTTTASAPKVALHFSEAQNVRKLQRNNGMQNLDRQLRQLGISLAASTEGQPRLTGLDAPNAYIIPAQSGPYPSTHGMLEVSSYVAAGGLVIIVGAASGEGQETRTFVASALNYNGNWKPCERNGTSEKARRRSGTPVVSEHAYSFLMGDDYDDNAWPLTLEDVHVLTTLTRCEHEDPRAVAIPLYTLMGDDNKVAVQAFMRAGNPGAVVWLGYSWRDGPQERWGFLLHKLITDFALRDGRSAAEAPPATPSLGDLLTPLAASTPDPSRGPSAV
ncbi:hypothetical protein Agub_g11241 [Astrephomene gubernaculifera]|uniref:Uncharacterized protein n=1 Tax=Astrephomene gubernaculifera TaxID=47775 RepID=A0AAD3DW76_9CHLO|nr:hypothetical protein Agub_g11241 [Astrephomene gubernaculifera]